MPKTCHPRGREGHCSFLRGQAWQQAWRRAGAQCGCVAFGPRLANLRGRSTCSGQAATCSLVSLAWKRQIPAKGVRAGRIFKIRKDESVTLGKQKREGTCVHTHAYSTHIRVSVRTHIRMPGKTWLNYSVLPNSCTEVEFTLYTTRSCKGYSSAVFSVFTKLGNRHHSVGTFACPQEEPCAR